jgi:CRP-like cAMP-binding protein
VSASEGRLRRTPFFRELSDEDFRPFTELTLGTLTVGANRDFVQAGEVGGHLYVVLEGVAFRYKTWPAGKRQIFDFLLPGDLVGTQSGLLGMIDHSVRALTMVRLSIIDARGFDELHRRGGNLALALVKSRTAEERRMDNRFAMIGRRSAVERLAFLLADLYERQLRQNAPTTEGAVLFPLRRQHMADALGLTGAHINRTLNQFRERRLATVADGMLVVHDRRKLAELAGYDSIMRITGSRG